MSLYKFKPKSSGNMGIIYTLSTIKESIIIEIGKVGDFFHSSIISSRIGINRGTRMDLIDDNEIETKFHKTINLESILENAIKEYNPRVIFFILNFKSNKEKNIFEFKIERLENLYNLYRELQIIYIPYSNLNMEFYESIEETLLFIARKFAKNDLKKRSYITYNIIGSCFDFYKFDLDIEELNRILVDSLDIEQNVIFTSNTFVSNIENLGKADINLVIRQEGIKTAEFLKEKFNIPYLYFRPYGLEQTIDWIDKISTILNIEKNYEYIKKEIEIVNEVKEKLKYKINFCKKRKLFLGGHIDVVRGIGDFAIKEMNFEKGEFWSSSIYLEDDEIKYYDQIKIKEIFHLNLSEIIMTDGENIESYFMDSKFQISNPDMKWRLKSPNRPFVGFRGALELINIWNDILDKENCYDR